MPQRVEQTLDVLHVAPGGHCASPVHCTHRPAGNMLVPVGRKSQVLLVAWPAQSKSERHWTQRLLGRSQIVLPCGLEAQPLATVPHDMRPSAAPLSPRPPPVAPDPPEPPVDPPDPVVPVPPPLPVVEPPVPIDVPAAPVLGEPAS